MKNTAAMKKAFMLMSVLGGCTGIEAPVPEVGEIYGGKTGDDIQGRHLLGSFADGLLANNVHFRVSTIPASNSPTKFNNFTLSVTSAGPLGVNGANLVATWNATTHSGHDSWFEGLIMDGPNGAQLKIVEVEEAADDPDTSTSYTLEYLAPNATEWVDYCEGEDKTAIALHGAFNERRIHGLANTISFACKDGVARKCNDWGYVAGTGGPGDIDWNHHQTCVQMANAAYCGGALSGLPFTREETPIVIQDFRPNYAKPDPSLPHPDPFPGDPDTYYFEAAWRPHGLPPVCLSKLRWASLPPDPCPGMLPDPRTSTNPEHKFCDDMTYQDMFDLGARIVQGSKMMDARLHRWRDPGTQDVVTTIRGFYVPRDPASSTIPFGTYTEYLGPDGMILRNLPGTLDPDVDMIELFMHHSADFKQRVVSDGVAIPGLSYDPRLRSEFEGYAFKKQSRVQGLTKLTVCADANGGYDTQVTAPCAASVAAPMFALP